MDLRRILFHTRFGENALEALVSLFELNAVGLETVVLTYVIPREKVAFVPYGGYLKDEEARIRREAEARFAPWCGAAAARGVEARVRIEAGSINAELLRIAAEEKAGLIVTGSKKRTSFERLYVGGHVLDLLRRSPVPVVMGKYMVLSQEGERKKTRINDRPFARPMLATDWSDPAARGMDALTAMGPLVEKAMVAHVIEKKLADGRGAQGLRDLEEESRQRLEHWCRDLAGAAISAEPLLATGKSAHEILRLAREADASMIIMGRTGKDWLQEYFLGGVSHRVAEHAEVPVMLVP